MDRSVFARCDRLSAVADTPVDGQGSQVVSSRSGAVVAVPDLLWTLGALLSEHPLVPLQQLLHRLGQPGQLLESLGRRNAHVDVHHAIHLPNDQLGRSTVLDPGTASGAAREDPLGQVSVRCWRIDCPLLGADSGLCSDPGMLRQTS